MAERRLATYEDILALPEHITGEIIAGELYTSPRPPGHHAFVTSELIFIKENFQRTWHWAKLML